MLAWGELVRWGVIDAARRRQRLHRRAAFTAFVAVALAGAIVLLHAPTTRPPHAAPRSSSSLTSLAGPRLGSTALQLVASQNGGPVALVHVDSGNITPLRQLDVPRNQVGAVSLSPYRGDALAVVTHQVCAHCAITEDDFLISASATVRHLLTRHFPAFDGSIERAQVPGALAEWLLRRPRHGACTLRLMPSALAAVSVPCGDLGEVNADGIVLWTNQDQLLVDPRTGAVRSRLPAGINQVPVGRGYAIRGPTQGKGTLSLINLASGEHRTLGWPSPLHFGYMLFPDPAGPLVAIEFADPAYPDYTSPTPTTTIGQAADLWVVNLHTGRLARVPGFPILEGLKVSSVAWTADGRLVVAAKGGGFAQSANRVAIAVWRPGQIALPVGPLPPRDGYNQIVPLSR